ncbi:MAG: hypothetical protein AAGC46_08165 [Solirubrobacteraceae bacterium]
MKRAAMGIAAAGTAAAIRPLTRAARAASADEPRYRGYRDADLAQPYAKYMKAHTDPAPAPVHDAVAAGPVDPGLIPDRAALAAEFHDPGYSPVETGYGRTRSGQVWVACLTDMPRVDPEMWDWWFAWHSVESARYKLWHPDGHRYSSLKAGPLAHRVDLQDRERYRGTVSYVDEEIGGHLDELAITFRDPAALGIDLDRVDGTVICGRVGGALLPVNVGMVCHQVRRTATGSEMRSRFYLNVPSVRRPDLVGALRAVRRGLTPPPRLPFPTAFGADLLLHCGEEMHHLAQFLPELHAEFS